MDEAMEARRSALDQRQKLGPFRLECRAVQELAVRFKAVEARHIQISSRFRSFGRDHIFIAFSWFD
jgi:hypothetical protein